MPVGLDDMGNAAAGRLAAGNVTSGGGDGVTTANATGGLSSLSIAQSQLPNIAPSFTGTPGTPTGTFSGAAASPATIFATNSNLGGNGVGSFQGALTQAGLSWSSGAASFPMPNFTPAGAVTINAFTPAGSVSSINGGVGQSALLMMNPFLLGSWYLKL